MSHPFNYTSIIIIIFHNIHKHFIDKLHQFFVAHRLTLKYFLKDKAKEFRPLDDDKTVSLCFSSSITILIILFRRAIAITTNSKKKWLLEEKQNWLKQRQWQQEKEKKKSSQVVRKLKAICYSFHVVSSIHQRKLHRFCRVKRKIWMQKNNVNESHVFWP